MTNDELEERLRRAEAETQRAEEPGELFWRRFTHGVRGAHDAQQRRRQAVRRRWTWSLAPLGALAAAAALLLIVRPQPRPVEPLESIESVSGVPRLGGAADEDELLDGLSDAQLQALARRLRDG